MIALIRIEIDENHLAKETNDIYDRLQGYNSVLMPLPRRLDYHDLNWYNADNIEGWNDCLDEITGASNGTGTN